MLKKVKLTMFILEYCVSVSSSRSPTCGPGAGSWVGDTATLQHNGVEIGTLPRAFTNKKFCLPAADVDVVNDQFKIVNGGNDGVSLLNLHVAGPSSSWIK